MKMATGLVRLALAGWMATVWGSGAAAANMVMDERPLGEVLAAATESQCQPPRPVPSSVCAEVYCIPSEGWDERPRPPNTPCEGTGTCDGQGNCDPAVVLPPAPVVHITNSVDDNLFVQALRTSNSTIYIANDVAMNLSYWSDIDIADGVTVIGGRTPREPGPLLYTSTFPARLFSIVDKAHVRITGVRIQGAHWDVGSEPENCCIGIYINSSTHITLENNEIYGWRNSAVEVNDIQERIDFALNPETVRIRGNYIHHNQNYSRLGYGVNVSKGAYAVIEQNVFDYNRHAIASDGREHTGYYAYANLVLAGGGVHCWEGICGHTHQFDMHGRDTCGIGDIFSDTLYNCGPAGEYLEVMWNSFFYTAGYAFKLRGTPAIDANVAFNVFAHTTIHDAVTQTEHGLDQWENLVGVRSWEELGHCDLDGDGRVDAFLATGQTWWYSSGGDRPWVYLHTSPKRRHQVTLGDVTGDGRCDVVADGIVYPGGRP